MDDPSDSKPNWISMRTGGQYSRYHQDDPRNNSEENFSRKRDAVKKKIDEDRKLIDKTKKTNAPIYNQIDVSLTQNPQYLGYLSPLFFMTVSFCFLPFLFIHSALG